MCYPSTQSRRNSSPRHTGVTKKRTTSKPAAKTALQSAPAMGTSVRAAAAPRAPTSRINGNHVPRALSSPLGSSFYSDYDSQSLLVARNAFAADSGLTYGGARDLYRSLGYKRTLGFDDYKRRYERGDIAERIIEAYPLATWAGGARIVEDPSPETETMFERAVRELFDKRDIWARITRADILAGLGRFAVLLLGAPGKLDTELPMDLNDLLYVRPIPENMAAIEEYEDDVNSERFGLPKFYTIRIQRADKSAIGSTSRLTFDNVRVHWTRVIHIAEGLLENDVYGKPRLRAVWNKLDDLDKVVGGGSEATWKRADPGLHVDVDPEIVLTEDEENALSAEIDEYQHDLRRAIRTRGTKLEVLASQVQGFGPNADAIINLISGTTGIPKRILMGSERGELASTQDRSNWADRIAERRRGFATPLVRLLIGRLIERGVLPTPEGVKKTDAAETTPVSTVESTQTLPGGYDILWPEVGDINNAAKADVVAKLAASNQSMQQANLPPVILPNEIRHTFLGLGPLDETELKSLAKTVGDMAKERTPPQLQDPNAPTNDSGTGPPAGGTQTDNRKSGPATPAQDTPQAAGGGSL